MTRKLTTKERRGVMMKKLVKLRDLLDGEIYYTEDAGMDAPSGIFYECQRLVLAKQDAIWEEQARAVFFRVNEMCKRWMQLILQLGIAGVANGEIDYEIAPMTKWRLLCPLT